MHAITFLITMKILRSGLNHEREKVSNKWVKGLISKQLNKWVYVKKKKN